MITIAGINCANDLNTEHCREYEIMGYPTIRYFKPNTVNFTIGENFQRIKDDVTVLRHSLIKKLESTELEFPPTHWPHLKPIREEEIYTQLQNPDKKEYTLVVENKTSFLGRELIMDLNGISWLVVRRILRQDYKASPIEEGILAVHKDDQMEVIPLPIKSRTEAVAAVRVAYKYYSIPDVYAENQVGQKTWIVVEQGVKQRMLVNTAFQDDIEKALHFCLLQEIALKPSISGDAFRTLIDFLNVVRKYFPFSVKNESFISRVTAGLNDSITGGEFKKLLHKYGENFFQTHKSWHGCAGSTESFRGYPCSLWMMFHTLTVREYLMRKYAIDSEVLSVMPKYVRYFFGCQECAEHFVEMSKTIQGNVSSSEDAVLWLWRAHNSVNKRLAGDGSEDPAFPKVQFPLKEMCPKCHRSDNTWDENHVLKYIVNMYSNIQVGNRQALSTEVIVSSKHQTESADHSYWNFSLTDVNACIGLYVLSACLLTIYTVRLFLKRGPRSRTHKHDICYKP